MMLTGLFPVLSVCGRCSSDGRVKNSPAKPNETTSSQTGRSSLDPDPLSECPSPGSKVKVLTWAVDGET